MAMQCNTEKEQSASSLPSKTINNFAYVDQWLVILTQYKMKQTINIVSDMQYHQPEGKETMLFYRVPTEI